MNYIGKVLEILQDWDSEIGNNIPIYTKKYTITLDSLMSRRRILIRTRERELYGMLDIIVGYGVRGDTNEDGLSHFTMNNSVRGKACHTWYQMRIPCDSFCTVNYMMSDNFVDSKTCTVDITSEEDVFQKSMLVDIDVDMIQSLVLEMVQLPQYIAQTENLLVQCCGYDKIDFNEILEALNV